MPGNETPEETPRSLTVEDVAGELLVHVDTVRHWIRDGLAVGGVTRYLQTDPMGGNDRIRPEALRAFLRALDAARDVELECDRRAREAEAQQAAEGLAERLGRRRRHR